MVWDGPTRKKQVENIGGPVSAPLTGWLKAVVPPSLITRN